ncbi:hypothetical protein BO70DRAFT_122180 [Aspergillus heteromorphus CBS 117.55]|uniref:Uncharacterized protein n=1 Tax=Aspergillus heteromorphus CBS 117.55 TaxID=1448321 RepID=A0A317VCL7_9EURO|nr:uncharacterized protein BO70DRAFT_122180 [Aspergillus heteromorphus CBS 117.55]PWY71735.1 hypothetical protein BO70DRAFT_122180 [Aspergillus heteromorphus CBS 117.55]
MSMATSSISFNPVSQSVRVSTGSRIYLSARAATPCSPSQPVSNRARDAVASPRIWDLRIMQCTTAVENKTKHHNSRSVSERGDVNLILGRVAPTDLSTHSITQLLAQLLPQPTNESHHAPPRENRRPRYRRQQRGLLRSPLRRPVRRQVGDYHDIVEDFTGDINQTTEQQINRKAIPHADQEIELSHQIARQQPEDIILAIILISRSTRSTAASSSGTAWP